jgi:hypothetical protein
MRDRTYRILITVLAVCGTVTIPEVLLDSALQSRLMSVQEALALAGLGSLPIAVLGLWLVRPWGIYFLAIGLVLTLVCFPAVSVFHVLILLLTTLRNCFARREQRIQAAIPGAHLLANTVSRSEAPR